MKITFIIGPSGVGKSSFIEREYAGKERVCIFNIARKAKELFGNYEAMKDSARELQIINESCREAFFTLMDGEEVVVEYYSNGFDDGLFAMCKKANSIGIRTELITLTCDADVAWERVQKAGPDYFSSAKIKEDTEMLFLGVLEDVEFNMDFDRICEVGAEGGTISFFRFRKGNEDRFFFNTDESDTFDFEPKNELDKIKGVNYVREYGTFSDAFAALLDTYPIFSLVPLKVHAGYQSEFRKAYQKFLNGEQAFLSNHDWNQHLN